MQFALGLSDLLQVGSGPAGVCLKISCAKAEATPGQAPMAVFPLLRLTLQAQQQSSDGSGSPCDVLTTCLNERIVIASGDVQGITLYQ